jgi:hypothetical protein
VEAAVEARYGEDRSKCTLSQTVKALERKRLVEEPKAGGETFGGAQAEQAGKAMMTKDTWSALALTCDAVGNKTRRRMGRGLADILS